MIYKKKNPSSVEKFAEEFAMEQLLGGCYLEKNSMISGLENIDRFEKGVQAMCFST